MDKDNPRICEVEDEMYGVTMHLYLGFSFKDYVKHLKDKYGITRDGESGHGETTIVGGDLFMWLDPDFTKDEVICTLVHECVHATHFILNTRSIPMNMENTEVMAYHTDFVFRKLAEAAGLL